MEGGVVAGGGRRRGDRRRRRRAASGHFIEQGEDVVVASDGIGHGVGVWLLMVLP